MASDDLRPGPPVTALTPPLVIDVGTQGGPATSRPDAAAVTVALGVGAVVAGLVVAARLAGLLGGGLGLVVLCLALVAVPTSRNAARRVLLAGALALGAAPLLWLVPLPVGDVGRVTVVLATVTGGLATWVLWAGRTAAASRARRIVPSLRPVDALPLLAGLGGALVTAPWWRVTDPATALATLLRGWDNSAHFSMTAMIRSHGLTVDRLADPGLEHWKFVEYPQGFHSATAALMETFAGPRAGSPADEVVLYLHSAAWLLVLACVVAAAGVAALPSARRYVVPGVAATAAIVAVVAVAPGGESFTAGFPNFVLAAVLAACVPLLAVTMPRVAMPLELAALASLLVAVAQGWLLLLVVAGPAAAVVLVGRGAWRGSRRDWASAAAIAALALVGLAWVLRTVSALDASEVLVIEGGIVMHSPTLMAAVAVLTPALLLIGRRWSPRLGWLAVGPAAGVVATALLGLYQRATAGGLSYYFWKLLLGLLVIDLILLAAAAAVVLPRLRWSGMRRPSTWHAVASAGAVLAGVAALVATGYLPTGERTFPVSVEPAGATSAVLAAAGTVGPHHAADTAPPPRLLLLPPDAGIHPLNAQQWFLGITGRWTVEANARGHALIPPPSDVAGLAAAARDALEASPDARVVAPPELAEELRAALGSLGEGRIDTWE